MKIINQIALLSLSLFAHSYVYADISHGVLEKHKKNDVFICVGIYSCVSLARALNAGFTELHGIDESKVLVDHARVIFPKDINSNPFNVTDYHMHHGAIDEFQDIIFKINRPMTIFLGSHSPSIDEFKVNTVLDELDVIKMHPIKTHTILIDYVNYAGTDAFGGISLDALRNKLLEINSQYRFSMEKGGRLEKEAQAILVAYI